MESHYNLLESLQREFCPPLDSSLLAAFLSDLESETVEPSPTQIDELKAQLAELAAQAEFSQLTDQLTDPLTEGSTSGPSLSFGDTSTTSTTTNDSDFATPLGFLRTAFPDVSIGTLRAALMDAYTTEEADVDMWEVIAELLSDEAIRELAERGLEDLDDDDAEIVRVIHEEACLWEIVDRKKPRVKGKKKNWGQTVALVDIRQRQHAPPALNEAYGNKTAVSTPDAWSQVASLSSHIATSLPPHQPSFFQSYFHSPNYRSPYHAVVAALQSIASQVAQEDHAATLINLLDILLPSFDFLDSEQRSRLIADAELCLQATEGKGEETLELVRLLQDLYSDSSSGILEMGIYHHPPAKPTDLNPVKTTASDSKLPSGPPSTAPPPAVRKRKSSPPSTGRKPSPYQWQKIPYRRTHKNIPHPLVAHIPAYTRDVNGMKVRGSGNGIGKGSKGDIGELQVLRNRIQDSMRRRNEMLREASRMWQRGNAKSRGGEVAMYFAEKAREYQELAKKDALDMSRMMVQSKRLYSQDNDTIDLHGTSAAEAIQIVKEYLAAGGYARADAKSFKIVTGRGAHSANQVSVLKPAIQKALLADGWNVSAWDAGLIVRGKWH